MKYIDVLEKIERDFKSINNISTNQYMYMKNMMKVMA